SRRRWAAIRGRLRRRGLPGGRLDRLKAPAGLDLGAITPGEIAISILAEIVQHRRSGKAVEVEGLPCAATQARDPICGMLVEITAARFRSEVRGRTTYFCCIGCKGTFDQDPARYLTEPA